MLQFHHSTKNYPQLKLVLMLKIKSELTPDRGVNVVPSVANVLLLEYRAAMIFLIDESPDDYLINQ